MQRVVVLGACACVFASCGSDRSGAAPTRSASDTQATGPAALVPASTEQVSGRDPCPRGIPPANISTETLDGGAALLFTTQGDVAALRAAIARLAPPPSVPAPRLDKVSHGIRLVYDAPRPNDAPKIQSAVAEHARDLAKRCSLIPGVAGSDESEDEDTRESWSPATPPAPASTAPPAPPKPSADAGTTAPQKTDRADAGAPQLKAPPREAQPEKLKPEPPAHKGDAGEHPPDASPRP